MSINEFLADMDEDDYPHSLGPWRSFDAFDPPYKRIELRQMRSLGVIQLDEREKRFRLTLFATDQHEKAA
jgi:hypothetical protein